MPNYNNYLNSIISDCTKNGERFMGKIVNFISDDISDFDCLFKDNVALRNVNLTGVEFYKDGELTEDEMVAKSNQKIIVVIISKKQVILSNGNIPFCSSSGISLTF